MITIQRSNRGSGLQEAVRRLSGVDLAVCLQCKKCSSGCPVAKLTKARPSELIRRLHLGAGEELLASDLIWTCASCETCSARCPMGLEVAAVIDALRKLALARGAPPQTGDVPCFNRAFLRTVQVFGRAYEIGMIGAYKLATGKLKHDLDKFPALVKKGKISLLPPLGGDRKGTRRIFKRARQNPGGHA